MCGIAAIMAYGPGAPPVDAAELRAIGDAMASRGPDDEGLWLAADGRPGPGHRRLAIIDPSPAGHQPMAQHLCGMYAFAIWDSARRRLFLARNPFEIKPLYYADDGASLRVASQVEALRAGGARGASDGDGPSEHRRREHQFRGPGDGGDRAQGGVVGDRRRRIARRLSGFPPDSSTAAGSGSIRGAAGAGPRLPDALRPLPAAPAVAQACRPARAGPARLGPDRVPDGDGGARGRA